MGTNLNHEPLNSKDLGVVPRSINYIFEKIKILSNEFNFTTKISYLELYNEEIRDLIIEKYKTIIIIDQSKLLFYKKIILVI